MDRIDRLIRDFFPWRQSGSKKPLDRVSRRAVAENWIKDQLETRSFDNVALALHARVQKIVEGVEAALPTLEKPRLFYRSDLTHLVKSPDSILDKMARDWDPARKTAPSIGFDSILDSMDDLARFRIVLNFLSDAKDVCKKIEEPYRCKPARREKLTAAQQELFSDFELSGNCLKDLIQLLPDKRNSGERCHKGLFLLRKDPKVKVEVQIQTMLQEAWDKKDHFLIYERRRRGEHVDEDHGIEIYAMSELLYVADLTFDRLLDMIRKTRHKT